MMKTDHEVQLASWRTDRSRRARLHSLLFTGAALGTTLLTVGAMASPKIPPFVGE